MKTLFQVLTMVACGVTPIVIVFLLMSKYLILLNDTAIYFITIAVVFYYVWYSTFGINKVKSWFV